MIDESLAEDEVLTSFLIAVNAETGAGAEKTSMYTVGERLEMARAEAQRAAETLIGMGLLEVRTLSGDIGLTEEGVAACVALGGGTGGDAPPAGLSGGPIMTDSDRAAAEAMAGQLKFLAGDKSWAFDALTDLMADLKTIDAQLMSSRPKTAIVKECFRSMQELLRDGGHRDVAEAVGRLVGEVTTGE